MIDLTVIVLTKNEINNIRNCIQSIRKIAKRVIVVDSFSSDGTQDIAQKLGAEVFEHKFVDHAHQFNWALNNCDIRTTWVAKFDADEVLTPELIKEINLVVPTLTPDINGIILRRRVYFLGKWLKHGGKYPELLLRIFRFNHGRSENRIMDEHLIITDGKTITLKNDFIDNNKNDLTTWINKHNWYSNKEVRQQQLEVLKSDGDANNSIKQYLKQNFYYKLPPFFRAHLYFIYRYYFRLGFLDGKEGKIYSFLQAYWYRYLVDAKLFECKKDNIQMEEQGELK